MPAKKRKGEKPKGPRRLTSLPMERPPPGVPARRPTGKGSAVRKMGRRRAIGIITGSAAGVTGLLLGGRGFLKYFERRRRERINAEHGRLTKAGFGAEQFRHEWSHISVEMRKAVGKEIKYGSEEYRERKLMEYLKGLERILQKTEANINERKIAARRAANPEYLKALERGITPIDVARTIRRERPTKKQAELIGSTIEQQLRDLKKYSAPKPGYKEKRKRILAEIVRLENVQSICRETAELGDLGSNLNAAINHIPKDALDDILRDRKANKL